MGCFLGLTGTSGVGKNMALAARLRRETTLTLRATAARVHLGSSKSANARLYEWMRLPNKIIKHKKPASRKGK
jgi:hypothetical protein